MQKTFLQEKHTCSVQKTARKSTKYWRNATILKDAAHTKAIYSLCKMVSLGQKLKMPKICEKPLYKNSRVVLWKRQLEKTPNI